MVNITTDVDEKKCDKLLDDNLHEISSIWF